MAFVLLFIRTGALVACCSEFGDWRSLRRPRATIRRPTYAITIESASGRS